MILRVLSMYNDPAQREAEIKNMSTVFKVLAEEILPQLRRSKLIAAYQVIGKTDEVIANLAKNSPKELNVEELLYAATLVKTSNRAQYLKEVGSIYKSMTEIYLLATAVSTTLELFTLLKETILLLLQPLKRLLL